MTARLEFFFDYGSPYSYLADCRLDSLRKRTGCELVYRPMLIGGVFKATGNQSPVFETVEAKKRSEMVDMQRWVNFLRVRFQHNPFFPINTLPIMRAAHAAQRSGVFPSFHRAVYPAFWAQAKNLGDPEVFAEALRGAGIDGKGLIAAAQKPDVKDSLRRTTDEAVERGAFGAPTFFVGDEMFFGNDRLAFVERALRGEPS